MTHYVWIDCEMTGLDTVNDCILELACIITTPSLHQIASYSVVLHKHDSVLSSMHPWCIKHHSKSELTQRVKDSQTTLSQAQVELLEFIKLHVHTKKSSFLAGSSVHMDKIFMMREFPEVIEYLHHRIIDVSTVKELCREWNPKVFQRAPEKKCGHRATDDILESIQELKYYKECFIKCE